MRDGGAEDGGQRGNVFSVHPFGEDGYEEDGGEGVQCEVDVENHEDVEKPFPSPVSGDERILILHVVNPDPSHETNRHGEDVPV